MKNKFKIISDIEEALIQKLSLEKMTDIDIGIVCMLSNKYQKITFLDLAEYYNYSNTKVSLLSKKMKFINNDTIRKIEKMYERYSGKKIFIKPSLTIVRNERQILGMLKTRSIKQTADYFELAITDVRYNFVTSPNKKANKQPKGKPKRENDNLNELKEYEKLKELGYKNATEYIVKHGSRSYRKEILIKS